MSPSRLAPALLAIGLTIHAIIAVKSFVESPRPASDFDRYYQIASGQGRPYVDYQVEHPIGTLLVFKTLGLPGTRAAFGRGVVTVNTICDATIVAALAWGFGLPAAAYYAVVSSPISGLLFNRIDFWSMAAATLAVAAWRRRHLRLAGGAFAVGASLKLWPLVLAASLATEGRRARAAVGVLLLVGGSLAAAALAISGVSAIVQVLTFRNAHGWQIESVIGSVLHAISSEPPRMESGSWRIGEMPRFASTGLFLAAAPLALWSSLRGFQTSRAGAGWLASVSWLLLLSALLSAQYIGWLIPGGAIAWSERNRRLAIGAALCVALTQAFWTFYGDVLDGARFAVWFVVIRNVALAWLAFDATVAIADRGLRVAD